MKQFPLLAGALLLAGAATAQTLVVPNGMAASNPGSTTLAWRNVAFRFQMLYDEGHFTAQGVNHPMLINRLRFRAVNGATSPGGETYTGVTINMSSSPSDWSNPSTTFASNTGVDNVTVFSGNITATAATGTSPNDYIIDVPLQTPFLYDPASGLDLLIDVDAPTAPAPATLPSFAAASSATDMARRISTTTVGGATGSTSYFALVALLDYTIPPSTALASKYGSGCARVANSFYEDLTAGSFDLSGAPGAPTTILLTPNANGGYDVGRGSGAWFTPTSPDLALTDDSLSPAQALGFTFNYPGGSTTDITVCSNGFVWLDVTQTAATFSGTPARLLGDLAARFAPLWHDMNPTTGGTIHFDVDPAGGAAYATWLGVPLFNNAASLNTMQLALFANGNVEFRYESCTNDPGMVGWSTGNGAIDPGSIDLSASLPFSTGADLSALAFEPLDRPVLGSTNNLDIRNMPANATVAAVTLGFSQTSVDLGGLGAPGCTQYGSADAATFFLVNTSSQVYSLPIPNNVALAGLHIYAQAFSGSTVNALNLIASNGVDLLLDIN